MVLCISGEEGGDGGGAGREVGAGFRDLEFGVEKQRGQGWVERRLTQAWSHKPPATSQRVHI